MGGFSKGDMNVLERSQWEKILGKKIRNDTMYVLNHIIFNHETYVDIIHYIENNRTKLNLRSNMLLVKESTIQRYIDIYEKYVDKQVNIPVISEEQYEEERANNVGNLTGIYGIYVDDELYYIGKTTKGFKDRFQSHKYNLKNSDDQLYRILRLEKERGKTIVLKPIIIVEQLCVNGKLKPRDINMMELALINEHQPKCNIQGKITPYPVTKW